MAATILAELAEQSAGLRARELAIEAREAELDRREAELAASMEAFTLARQDGTMWAQATAIERGRWLTLIAAQMEHLHPAGSTATHLRRLAEMGREAGAGQ